MPATPIHHTPTSSSGWNGPEQVKNLFGAPMTKAIGFREFAWYDPDKDLTTQVAWKFPHHFSTNHKPGAASTTGCSAGIAALNGARGGSTIPEADRQGVYAHLKAHLVDHGVKEADVPELKSPDELLEERADTKECPTCEGKGTIMDGHRTCPDCNGDGTVSADAEAKSPAFDTVKACRAALYGNDELRSEVRSASETRTVRQMDPDCRIAQQFEMREVANGTGGTSLRFTGYASVVERGYEVYDAFGPYQETIARNAFNKTLKDGADVSFLVNHGGITMARTKPGTLQLSSDSTGLYTEATLNLSRPDVQIVRAAVEDGDLDEMSFAFRATRQEWDADYTQREIQEVNMHQGDVSIVNYGANPATGGTVALRSRLTTADVSVTDFIAALTELRAGASISAANMKTLSTVLDLVQGADTNVDHALVILSNLMGVKNPDIAQDKAMDKGDPSKNTPPSTTTSSGESDAPTMSTNSAPKAEIPDHTLEARQRLAAMRDRRAS